MAKFKKAKFKTSIKVRRKTKSLNVSLLGKKESNSVDPNTTRTCTLLNDIDPLDQHSASSGLSSHEKRRVNVFENWSNVRKELQDAFIESSFLQDDSVCVICGARATVRCESCGPCQLFCNACARDLHTERNQFHLLQVWKNGMFVPLYPDHSTIGYGHRCSTQKTKPFTLIDSQGITHIKSVELCDCEPEAITLVKCNFWPGSPKKPSLGIHIHLMIMMNKIFLQSQVSIHDFVEILADLQPQLGLRNPASLYNILSSGCFEEFRLFWNNLTFMDSYVENLMPSSLCPLCPEDDGVLIESMDACMGLVRKKCKGTPGLIEPRFGQMYFSDQDDVDNFVDNYGQVDSKNNEGCSRFHAGEVLTSLRSKGKNQLFEEKGVFGRVCRHDFPKSFINLKHGERISYSIYEIKKLQESLTKSSNVKVILMYDIACILSTHLKNTNQEYLLSKTSLAIPIFHCYGHKASCQIEFSPRRIEGVGLTDGEGVERLWAYLRGYSTMTKEMGSEKRIDVLTQGLLFYAQRLINRVGHSLKTKLKKAQELLHAVDKELEELKTSLQTTVDNEMINQWKIDELKAIKPKESVLELSWDEAYVNVLLEIKQIKGDLAFVHDLDGKKVKDAQKQLKRKERLLSSTEKRQRIKIRWKDSDRDFENAKKRLLSKKRSALVLQLHHLSSERIFLLEMKKKYADGQGIAIKLSGQISKITESILKCIGTINALGSEDISFDDVKDPCGRFFDIADTSSLSDVPLATKKRLISLFCLRARCNEEIDMLKVEIIRIFQHFFKQVQILDEYAVALGISTHERGLKALLMQKKLCFQLEQSKLSTIFTGLGVSPYVIPDIRSYHFLSGNEEVHYSESIPENTEENGEDEELYECYYSSSDEYDD